MPVPEIVIGDLVDADVDVIVCPVDRSLRGGGAVATEAHRRGGPAVTRDCADRFPDGLPVGDAGATTAGNLRARWIVHVVGPPHGPGDLERALLSSCYRRALSVADELDAAAVAFPLIGAGANGWPPEAAAAVAIEALTTTATHVERIRIVGIDETADYWLGFALFTAVPRRILQGVREAHRRGYQQIRVLPGLSPSGMYWRLAISASADGVDDPRWFDDDAVLYPTTEPGDFVGLHVDAATRPRVIADHLIAALQPLQPHPDPRHAEWFEGLIAVVERLGHTPIAYADYFDDTAGWAVDTREEFRYPHPPERRGRQRRRDGS